MEPCQWAGPREALLLCYVSTYAPSHQGLPACQGRGRTPPTVSPLFSLFSQVAGVGGWERSIRTKSAGQERDAVLQSLPSPGCPFGARHHPIFVLGSPSGCAITGGVSHSTGFFCNVEEALYCLLSSSLRLAVPGRYRLINSIGGRSSALVDSG